ncbi:MAG: L-histidine N(alpha)-methyltransferase [Gammaproteobacteria bacterium]
MAQPLKKPALAPASEHDELLTELVEGLRERPKQVSPKYFYDAKGSELFEAICAQPEYYPTRTELAIMEDHLKEVATLIGPDVTLVEYGSGASLKTRLLLTELVTPTAYVPVDISRQYLASTAMVLGDEFPHIEMLPVAADFTRPFSLPEPQAAPRRRVLYFPGSTIGNFSRSDAVTLLKKMRHDAGPDGALLIGVDLVKPVAVLERAYNDAAGVTAAFNLNLLSHLNAKFQANFVADNFQHHAVWDSEHRRIEMRLISCRQQTVNIDALRIDFAPQEFLVTEHSHKYTPAGFAQLAADAGWMVQQLWTDRRQYFSVQYLVPARRALAMASRCA